uniref:Uncharacterized protein n=1 Tax=Rhizophora mucronata TaxID=61149 RepID=A0A2P2PZ36_RHIMU
MSHFFEDLDKGCTAKSKCIDVYK